MYVSVYTVKSLILDEKKSQNLDDTCLILQLSLPNPLKPVIKLSMKM